MSQTSPWLLLGRVSNLPTVWTNALAGIALGAGTLAITDAAHAIILCAALSLLYVGGMYLNDAFDRGFDAVHRPERPIPAGRVSARAVFTAGFAMLATGAAIATLAGFARTASAAAGIAAALLAAAIVLYDLHHKGNPWSPVLMGACRVLAVVTAALATHAHSSHGLVLACGALLAYLIGLTFIAKHETGAPLTRAWPLLPLALPVVLGLGLGLRLALSGRLAAGMIAMALATVLAAHTTLTLPKVLDPAHRNVPVAVAQLIAGISLVDGLVITVALAQSAPWLGPALALAGYALTRSLQRIVPGT